MAKYSNYHGGQSEVFSEFMRIVNAENKNDDYYGLETGEDLTGEDLLNKAHPKKEKNKDEHDYTMQSYRENGGLVEDLLEQQKEDIAVALRTPNCSTSRKSTNATEEFVHELTILAEEMNIYGEDKLGKFAKSIVATLKKKVAFDPVTMGAIGVGVVSLAAIGWYLSSRGDKDDAKNTGIDAHINKLSDDVDYYIELIPTMPEEQLSQIIPILNSARKSLMDIQKTRMSYMVYFQNLANKLRTLTKIDPSIGSITPEQVKKLGNSPEAKAIVKTMISANANYKKIIDDNLPSLKTAYDYLVTYFKKTKDSKREQNGIIDTVNSYLGSFIHKTKSLQDIGEEIVNLFALTIDSLKEDVKLREIETNATIKLETEKVQTDLSSQFQSPNDSITNGAVSA